jgi:hypothetical protein
MGRDIQAIKISGEDRRKYREKVQRSLDVFARMLRERRFEASPSRVGVEIELNLVDSLGAPSMRNAAVLDAIADPAWATELGQFNLEINVPPRRLEGHALTDLEQEIRASLNAADAKARGTGSRLVMVGILPTLAEEDMREDTISANDRYRVLNEQIFAARGEDLQIAIDGPEQLLTHSGSITPEAACTSVQLHVQVSPDAFASYWNAAQAIAGVQVALAANSPFLFGRRLWDETRITLFEQATDTRPDELKQQGVRPRVWFGERWITSVFDLFEENIRYFPALLPLCEDEDPLAVLDGGGIPELAEMWRTVSCPPGRRSRTSWPTRRSTTGSSGPWPTRSGRSGPRCRSRPRPRTCRRARGRAWTPGCTGPGWVRCPWPSWCCAACCRWPARACPGGASIPAPPAGCSASSSSAASPPGTARPGRSR